MGVAASLTPHPWPHKGCLARGFTTVLWGPPPPSPSVLLLPSRSPSRGRAPLSAGARSQRPSPGCWVPQLGTPAGAQAEKPQPPGSLPRPHGLFSLYGPPCPFPHGLSDPYIQFWDLLRDQGFRGALLFTQGATGFPGAAGRVGPPGSNVSAAPGRLLPPGTRGTGRAAALPSFPDRVPENPSQSFVPISSPGGSF